MPSKDSLAASRFKVETVSKPGYFGPPRDQPPKRSRQGPQQSPQQSQIRQASHLPRLRTLDDMVHALADMRAMMEDNQRVLQQTRRAVAQDVSEEFDRLRKVLADPNMELCAPTGGRHARMQPCNDRRAADMQTPVRNNAEDAAASPTSVTPESKPLSGSGKNVNFGIEFFPEDVPSKRALRRPLTPPATALERELLAREAALMREAAEFEEDGNAMMLHVAS